MAEEKSSPLAEAVFTHDVILLQFGAIKNLEKKLYDINPSINVVTVEDFFPNLKTKYKLKSFEDIYKLSDSKTIDFAQDAFAHYFEAVFGGVGKIGTENDKPSILVVERNFLDFIYYLNKSTKKVYETNSIFLCNYKLYDLVRNLLSFSFVRGIVNIPDLTDKDSIFYDEDYFKAAKNFLSYNNYVSLHLSHSLPINFDFYYTDQGYMLPIINFELENNRVSDSEKLLKLVSSLEEAEYKDRFIKFINTIPKDVNYLKDNYVWGQIIPTLLHFYSTRPSSKLKKNKSSLTDLISAVMSTNNSDSFLTAELFDVSNLAIAIRKEKLKHLAKAPMSKDQKYIN